MNEDQQPASVPHPSATGQPIDDSTTTPPAAPPNEPTVAEQRRPEGGDPRSRRPRSGPIIWGVLVLAFCAYTAFQAVAPGTVDGTSFVIAATISLGLLLLAVGVAVIARSSRNQRR